MGKNGSVSQFEEFCDWAAGDFVWKVPETGTD